MINIDELRQRVSDAERRFGLIDERQKAYSSRLSGMIEAVDSRQKDSDLRLRETEAALRRAKDDNEQLRSLLHQLLMAIDGAERDHLKTPISELSQRLESVTAGEQPEAASRVVTMTPEAVPSAPAAEPQPDRTPAETATAVPTGADAETAPVTADDEGGASVRHILRKMNEKMGDGASENVG